MRTPPAIAARLASAVGAVVADAEYKAQLAAMQFETFGMQGQQFEAFLRRELEFWAGFFRTTGIRLESN
jgi:tripartite-type tricarboxylate transporter receptor subunit TctC